MTGHELQHQLLDQIKIRSKDSQLFIVGVSGIDASGKSQIAKTLRDQLELRDINVLAISGDSFQFPREYKDDLQEVNWAVQHIRRTIDFQSMIEKFFIPLQGYPSVLPIDVIDYDT